jgi:hypothetical protein
MRIYSWMCCSICIKGGTQDKRSHCLRRQQQPGNLIMLRISGANWRLRVPARGWRVPPNIDPRMCVRMQKHRHTERAPAREADRHLSLPEFSPLTSADLFVCRMQLECINLYNGLWIFLLLTLAMIADVLSKICE